MMKVTKEFEPNIDRYLFDFKLCKVSDGWSQLDTDQDAWYYGNWANPITLKLVSYAEGDCVYTICESVEEFKKEIEKWFEWNDKNEHYPRIDCCGHQEAWRKIGFEVSDMDLITSIPISSENVITS